MILTAIGSLSSSFLPPSSALVLATLLLLLTTTAYGCKVTAPNGDDVTENFFSQWGKDGPAGGVPFVDCRGKEKCRDMVIANCPVVKCFDVEACTSASIVNFTESVLCEGRHACHRTKISAEAPDPDVPIALQKVVSCVGPGACDVATIVGWGSGIDRVSCSGANACRKVIVEGSKLVKCHNGAPHGHSVACTGLASFIKTECLYCGKSGCAAYINQCRYKLNEEDEDEDSDNSWKTCEPESIVGNCPAGLEAKLEAELNGREQIDGT